MKQRKKFLLNVLFLFMLLAFIGCGKENQENSQEEPQNGETINIEENGNGIVLFSTKYDVEDYCQGCFIVSKNDGLLYGVLDKEGKEILPVEYDNVEFLNANEVKEGIDSQVYLKTKYEDRYTIVNAKGNEILSEDATYLPYVLDENEKANFFYWENDDKIYFYNEEGKEIMEISKRADMDCNVIALSKGSILVINTYENADSFVVEEKTDGFYLYDVNGTMLHEWGNDTFLLKDYIFADEKNRKISMYTTEDNALYTKYCISENGIIDSVENVDFSILYEDRKENQKDEEYIGRNGDIHLFKSNDTWKLEDESGTPLYDIRYYDCTEVDDSYFLSNEDNQVCVIDRNGDKVIDYGRIKKVDDGFYFDDNIMRMENFFVGDDGVCYVHDGKVEFFSAS